MRSEDTIHLTSLFLAISIRLNPGQDRVKTTKMRLASSTSALADIPFHFDFVLVNQPNG